jgi:hypothetical protein
MLDTPEDVLKLFANLPTLFVSHSVMPAECKDCPFKAAREGRDYLAPGRLDGIKVSTLLGQVFHCHKTIYSGKTEPNVDPETGEESLPSWSPHYQQCAGAVEWAKEFLKQNQKEEDNV